MRNLCFPSPLGRTDSRGRTLLLLLWALALLCMIEGAFVPESEAKDKKSPPPAPTRIFSGRLNSLDLSHHPMTLSASLGKGRPLFFIFEGALIPDTMVLAKGKTVGVTALKKGQLLAISYRDTPRGAEILKIVLMAETKSLKDLSPRSIGTNTSSQTKKASGKK